MMTQPVGRSSNDPYLIYSFLHHHVEIQNGKEKIKGLVEKVCRDIFSGMIELTMNGKMESFREPEVIISTGSKEITFVYGHEGALDLTDDELFQELRDNCQYGETIDDILERTTPIKTRTIRIRVGEKEEIV